MVKTKEIDYGLFPRLYEPREEKRYFGKNFLFKGDKYIPKEWILIAKTQTAEDKIIKVYVTNWPAQFWEFRIYRMVRTSKNEVEIQPVGKISTGSGDWDDYKEIYELLSRDMLGVEFIKEEEVCNSREE